MIKRILDADALEKLVYNKENEMLGQVNLSNHQYIGIKQTFREIKKVINELVTIPPEPQGVWYDDFTKAPDEYIAHNGCRLAWVDHDTITPLGDISAFDEEYFRESMKQWQYMPQVPNGD